MDNRLFHIETRVGLLRRQDLPLLARALISVFRKQAVVKTGRTKNVGYVRIEAHDFHVQILAEDWAKILPYVQDETLNQVMVPAQVDPVVLNPLVAHDSSIIDGVDQQYYLRVLHILQGLFPTAYPTSPL